MRTTENIFYFKTKKKRTKTSLKHNYTSLCTVLKALYLISMEVATYVPLLHKTEADF